MAYGLKYHFTYYENNQAKVCEIYQNGYAGASSALQQVSNPVIVPYGSSNEPKYHPLKGSEATISILAMNGFNASVLYTEDEREWLVILKDGGQVFWRGFVQPDGCEEDFTSEDRYIVQINAVDGLGLLKNLNFVQESGNLWVGKMTPKDIIWNCLNRLQIPDMNLHTLCTLYETSMAETDDPLNKCLFPLERYFKTNGTSPMDCGAVLGSVLDTFGLQIIQSEGDWYVTQVDELATAGALTYFKYSSTTGAFVSTVSKNIDVTIGGHGSAIHHVFADQKKRLDKPWKQAIIRYEYGFVTALGDNPNMVSEDGTTVEGWDLSTATNKLLNSTGGIALVGDGVSPDSNYFSWDPVAVEATNKIRFSFTFRNSGYALDGRFTVTLTNGLSSYYLRPDGTWESTNQIISIENFEANPEAISDPTQPTDRAKAGDLTHEIECQPLPMGGNIIIRAYEPTINATTPYNFGNAVYLNITATPIIDSEASGKIYIAENPANCSFIPEIKTVYNADDTSAIYVGTIFRMDGTTPTSRWHRKGAAENKPLLSLVAENILRMHQRPFAIYEGSVKGYFAPLSRFTVSGIDGVLMMVSADYDTSEGITRVVLIQIDNTAIAGAEDVKIEYDYGQYQSSGSGSSGGGGISTGGGSPADYLTESEAVELFYPKTGNPNGYLTGITSGQVTGALGYTPYNPASYPVQAGGETLQSVTSRGGKISGVLYTGGYVMNAHPTHASSRQWLIHNDFQVYGDLSISRENNKNSFDWDSKLYFNPLGDMGLGTTTPSMKLHIKGSGYLGGQCIERTDTLSKWGVAGYADGGLQFFDFNAGTATRLILESSGAVKVNNALKIPAKNSAGALTGNYYEIYVEE